MVVRRSIERIVRRVERLGSPAVSHRIPLPRVAITSPEAERLSHPGAYTLLREKIGHLRREEVEKLETLLYASHFVARLEGGKVVFEKEGKKLVALDPENVAVPRTPEEVDELIRGWKRVFLTAERKKVGDVLRELGMKGVKVEEMDREVEVFRTADGRLKVHEIVHDLIRRAEKGDENALTYLVKALLDGSAFPVIVAPVKHR